MNEIQEQIWGVITSLNKAWTSGDYDDNLGSFFHPDMIALVSPKKKKIYGKVDCVAYWKSCSEGVVIRLWKECDPRIQVFGDGKFATVTYKFEFSFEKNTEVITISGQDLFSLVYENNLWTIVAATV